MENKPIINVNRSFSRSKTEIYSEEKISREEKKVTIMEPEEPEPEQESELKLES